MSSSNIVVRVLALPFIAASLFHLAVVLRPALAPDESTARHALFIGLNGLWAVGLARLHWARSRLFLAAFATFVAQQTWSHGVDLAAATRAGRFDWRSMVVLPFLPAVLSLLLVLRYRGGRPQ